MVYEIYDIYPRRKVIASHATDAAIKLGAARNVMTLKSFFGFRSVFQQVVFLHFARIVSQLAENYK